MTIQELAKYIRTNKKGLNYPGFHLSDDEGVVLQYTRHEMVPHVHITDEHIYECCAKASNYEEHIELCRPFALYDTMEFRNLNKLRVRKGRTRRRFR